MEPRRLASLVDRHLAAIDYEVVALDGDAGVTVCSELVTPAPVQSTDDPRRGKGFAEKVLVPSDARVHGDGALLRLSTRNSGLELGCGMAHRIDSPADFTVDMCAEGDGARFELQAELCPLSPDGRTLAVTTELGIEIIDVATRRRRTCCRGPRR